MCCCAATPKPPEPPAPDPLDKAAADAVSNKGLAEYAKKIEREIEPHLTPRVPQDLDRITHLAALREFGTYFSRLPKDKLTVTQIATLKWLTTQPKLLDTLMLATGKFDSPDHVLAVLEPLYLDMGDQLADWPDLMAAMCVVWDEPTRSHRDTNPLRKQDGSRPRQLMHYYVNAHADLRFDPRNLPWQLLVYVVDNLVSQEEIAWALDRYNKRSNIGATYFDVPYDYNAFYGSGANQPDAKGAAYTLQNLVLAGGVCSDQAYFASQVGRCVGVPAAAAAGQSGVGQAAHAWVGYFQVQGDHAEWNFLEGRYPEYRFFKGRVIDPQTREGITESDVSLSAELWDTPANKRLASIALAKVVDLVDSQRRAGLYMQAINLSPGNRDAWLALAQLGAKKKLAEAEFRELKDVINRFAVKQYPDFAFAVLRRAIAGRTFEQQIDELGQMGRMFDQTRPDLLAELDAAKGDLLRQAKRNDDALAIYGQALQEYGSSGAIATDLMDHVDDMLRQSGDLNRLADIYQFIWQRQNQPEPSAYVQVTPFFVLGERYEQVLKEIGDEADMQTVRARLDSLRASSKSMTPVK
ncbi:MAG TPA: hypothetical protein VHD56_09185 [Tepidisphaeraceae bacterium]|nr:hypothetical protein [Tepidisphaeraceae bacterium]